MFKFLFKKRIVRRRRVAPLASRKEYLLHKEAARAVVHQKLARYNQSYGFAYKKVFIKNLKSRWGSCSNKGNLNFTYRIALLPERLQNYLVVHELCHLGEFNHSESFWKLVERCIPDYKQLDKELKQMKLR